MHRNLTDCLRINTAPWNWIIQDKRKRRWVDLGYYDNLNDAFEYCLEHLIAPELEESARKNFDQFVDELDLNSDDDFSAWYLTRKRKHEAFVRQVSPNSLKFLKPRKKLSIK